MLMCIVVERDESHSLKHTEFDDKDEALAAIADNDRHCLLITVSAPLQCWANVQVEVEDHT